MKKCMIVLCAISFMVLSCKTTEKSDSSVKTSASCQNVYFTKLHFSKEAFGKEVVGVYAHIGVLQQNYSWTGGNKYWNNVQHIKMDLVNDHFFGKVIVKGGMSSHGYSNLGPIVQYWVYFKDGTEMIPKEDESAKVEVEDKASVGSYGSDYSWDSMYKQLEDELNQTEDASKTSAKELEECHVS